MGHPLAAWMGLNSRPGRWGWETQILLPCPEHLFPKGLAARCWCFIPGRAVSDPVSISHLTSINRAPTLLGTSQMVLGTRPSFSVC